MEESPPAVNLTTDISPLYLFQTHNLLRKQKDKVKNKIAFDVNLSNK